MIYVLCINKFDVLYCRSKIKSKGSTTNKPPNKAMNAIKLENLFGPISVSKEVSPAKYPNTVPLAKPSHFRDPSLIGNIFGDDTQKMIPQHSSAIAAGRRRPPQQEFLSNRNRDLAVKPSPYGLSGFKTDLANNNCKMFPWENSSYGTTAEAEKSNASWMLKDGMLNFEQL